MSEINENIKELIIFGSGIFGGVLITLLIFAGIQKFNLMSCESKDKTQVHTLTELEEWVDEDINTTIQTKKEQLEEIEE